MEIGNKILELRKKHNYSQEKMAELLNVSRQTISKWELGDTSPDITQAKKISKIFNISLDELVDNDLKYSILEKADNNNKLTRKILKVLIAILVFVCLLFCTISLIVIAFLKSFEYYEAKPVSSFSQIECSYDGNNYYYKVENDINDTSIIRDLYTNDKNIKQNLKIDLTTYNDANKLLDDIKNYIDSIGGKCK